MWKKVKSENLPHYVIGKQLTEQLFPLYLYICFLLSLSQCLCVPYVIHGIENLITSQQLHVKLTVISFWIHFSTASA